MNNLEHLRTAVTEDEKATEKAHARERIASNELTARFVADPDFPFLVSFSRTGSHWLRMLMELYFDKPSLKLLFFRPAREVNDFTCFHTHDMELSVQRKRVIYLYRDPVDTIFSQMMFYSQPLGDKAFLDGWTKLYAQHLYKWLIEEKFTEKKVVLTYEGMKNDLPGEFRKLSEFFGVPYDAAKLEGAVPQVSKEKIRSKTAHDPRVINVSENYAATGASFRRDRGSYIYSEILKMHPGLQPFLSRCNGNL